MFIKFKRKTQTNRLWHISQTKHSGFNLCSLNHLLTQVCSKYLNLVGLKSKVMAPRLTMAVIQQVKPMVPMKLTATGISPSFGSDFVLDPASNFKEMDFVSHKDQINKDFAKEVLKPGLVLHEKKIDQGFYLNLTLTKGRLKDLVGWCFRTNGSKATSQMVEVLKKIGYDFSTGAGISIGIDDLLVPNSKKIRISHARIGLNRIYQEMDQGHLSQLEYFDNLLSTWNRVNLEIKDEVLRTFRLTDPLNPVYMMAFSGARGNISQVRQLTGMRGLMSNQMGEVVSFAIQSNFRQGMTLTEYMLSCHGARKGVVDTALRTATSGYLTRRLVDVVEHLVVNAHDCHTYQSIKINGKYFKHSKTATYVGRVLAQPVYWQGERIGHRNQEIDGIAAKLLMSSGLDWYIRSPLTCAKLNGICRLCYGWGFGSDRLVSLGECVGILAGQSIGEPGTQLTMRTFHTGGVFSTTEVFEYLPSPHSGRVFFPKPLPGQCVRVRNGVIGYLVKQPFTVHIGTNILPLPIFTVIFMKQGQYIYKGQTMGEFADELIEKERTLQMINSSTTGQVYFDSVLKYNYNQVSQTRWVPNDPARRIHYWDNLNLKWYVPARELCTPEFVASPLVTFSHYTRENMAFLPDTSNQADLQQTLVNQKSDPTTGLWSSLLSDPGLTIWKDNRKFHRSGNDLLQSGALLKNTRLWLLNMEKQCLVQTTQVCKPTDWIESDTALTCSFTASNQTILNQPTRSIDLDTKKNNLTSYLSFKAKLHRFHFKVLPLGLRTEITLTQIHKRRLTLLPTKGLLKNPIVAEGDQSAYFRHYNPYLTKRPKPKDGRDFLFQQSCVDLSCFKARPMLLAPDYMYFKPKQTSILFAHKPSLQAHKSKSGLLNQVVFQYGLTKFKVRPKVHKVKNKRPGQMYRTGIALPGLEIKKMPPEPEVDESRKKSRIPKTPKYVKPKPLPRTEKIKLLRSKPNLVKKNKKSMLIELEAHLILFEKNKKSSHIQKEPVLTNRPWFDPLPASNPFISEQVDPANKMYHRWAVLLLVYPTSGSITKPKKNDARLMEHNRMTKETNAPFMRHNRKHLERDMAWLGAQSFFNPTSTSLQKLPRSNKSWYFWFGLGTRFLLNPTVQTINTVSNFSKQALAIQCQLQSNSMPSLTFKPKQEPSFVIKTRNQGLLKQNLALIAVTIPITRTICYEQKKLWLKYFLQPEFKFKSVRTKKIKNQTKKNVKPNHLKYGFKLYFKNSQTYKPDHLETSMTWTWKRSKYVVLPKIALDLNAHKLISSSQNEIKANLDLWSQTIFTAKILWHCVNAFEMFKLGYIGFMMLFDGILLSKCFQDLVQPMQRWHCLDSKTGKFDYNISPNRQSETHRVWLKTKLTKLFLHKIMHALPRYWALLADDETYTLEDGTLNLWPGLNYYKQLASHKNRNLTAYSNKKSNALLCLNQKLQLDHSPWVLSQSTEHYDPKMCQLYSFWCYPEKQVNQRELIVNRMYHYDQLHGWVSGALRIKLRYHNQLQCLGFSEHLNHTVMTHSYCPIFRCNDIYHVIKLDLSPPPKPKEKAKNRNKPNAPERWIIPKKAKPKLMVTYKKIVHKLTLVGQSFSFYLKRLGLYKQKLSTQIQKRCHYIHFYVRRQYLFYIGLPVIQNLWHLQRSIYISKLDANVNARYRPILSLTRFYILQIAQRDFSSKQCFISKPNFVQKKFDLTKSAQWHLKMQRPDQKQLETLHMGNYVYNRWPAHNCNLTKRNSNLRPRKDLVLSLEPRIYESNKRIEKNVFDSDTPLNKNHLNKNKNHLNKNKVVFKTHYIKWCSNWFKQVSRAYTNKTYHSIKLDLMDYSYQTTKIQTQWDGSALMLGWLRPLQIYNQKLTDLAEALDQGTIQKRQTALQGLDYAIQLIEEDFMQRHAGPSDIFRFADDKKYYLHRKMSPTLDRTALKEVYSDLYYCIRSTKTLKNHKISNQVRLISKLKLRLQAILFGFSNADVGPLIDTTQPDLRTWFFAKNQIDLSATFFWVSKAMLLNQFKQNSKIQGECVACNILPSQSAWRTRYNDIAHDRGSNVQDLCHLKPESSSTADHKTLQSSTSITLQKQVQRVGLKHVSKVNRQLDYNTKPNLYVYIITKPNLNAYNRISPKNKTPLLGAFITAEQGVSGDLVAQKPGQVFWIDRFTVMIRRAECYVLPELSRCHLRHGDCVDRDTGLMEVYFSKLMANDIIQGIAKIEGLFEARSTDLLRIPLATSKMLKFYEPLVLIDSPGQCNQKSLFATIQEMQMCIIDTIQSVYIEQGVQINDKHLELIVAQMSSKIRVVNPVNSGLLRSEGIDYRSVGALEGYNHKVRYAPIISGITQTALHSRSFLGAASFQESVSVLTRCSFNHSRDFLDGLKANTIIGNPLPMGTLLNGPNNHWLRNKTLSLALKASNLAKKAKTKSQKAKSFSNSPSKSALTPRTKVQNHMLHLVR